MLRQINFKTLPASGTGNAQEFHEVIIIQSSKLAIRILSSNARIGLHVSTSGLSPTLGYLRGANPQCWGHG